MSCLESRLSPLLALSGFRADLPRPARTSSLCLKAGYASAREHAPEHGISRPEFRELMKYAPHNRSLPPESCGRSGCRWEAASGPWEHSITAAGQQRAAVQTAWRSAFLRSLPARRGAVAHRSLLQLRCSIGSTAPGLLSGCGLAVIERPVRPRGFRSHRPCAAARSRPASGPPS